MSTAPDSREAEIVTIVSAFLPDGWTITVNDHAFSLAPNVLLGEGSPNGETFVVWRSAEEPHDGCLVITLSQPHAVATAAMSFDSLSDGFKFVLKRVRTDWGSTQDLLFAAGF